MAVPGLRRQPPIIVTRPQPQADEWVARLQAAGVPALACPLLETVGLSGAGPEALSGRAQGAGVDIAVWMFVSPAAVRFGLPQLLRGRPWPEALPQTLAAATGPGTAAALRAAGVPDRQLVQPPDDAPQFDSEALWAVLAPLRDWQGVRVGIVRGQSAGLGAFGKDSGSEPGVGRAWLADQWRAAGAKVQEWVAYVRRAPLADPERQALFDRAGAEPWLFVWLASSAEALGHWPDAVDVRRQVVLATHPAIAEVCTHMGFGRVLTCKPDVQAVATAWADWVATLD